MSHNLYYNYRTQRHSFFSVKQKAWHELGQIIEDYPTSQEAIQYAGLDYQVEIEKLYRKDGEEVQTHFASVRTDTGEMLGVVGKKYQTVQNSQAFTFFDSIVQDGKIKYETAGALGKGERIFITAKMPDVMKIGRKDEIEKYIFLTTSHDGSGSIMAALTPVRIVCNNTLNAALRDNSDAVYIKHTANAEQKLKEAARIMAISQSKSEILEQLFNQWAKVRITDPELKKLIRLAMSPNKETFQAIATRRTDFEFSSRFENICSAVEEYALTAEPQQTLETCGTLYGAYNAITGYYQNMHDHKSIDAKLNSILFGTAADRNQHAFEICRKASEFLS